MEWQELKNGFTMATVKPGEPTEQALTELCRHIKQHLIPKSERIAWDCLRIEFWADSGRIIALLSSTSKPCRIEKVGCQVVFSDLLAQYERLADSDLDDDAFVAVLLNLELEWIDKLLEAARNVSLTGNRFQFWEGEGERLILDNQL